MRISNNELEVLASKYKLKIRNLGSTIFITSKLNEWYLEDNGRYYKLFHKNTRNNTECYHNHDTYNTVEEAFIFIVEHDNFRDNETMNRNNTVAIKEILEDLI